MSETLRASASTRAPFLDPCDEGDGDCLFVDRGGLTNEALAEPPIPCEPALPKPQPCELRPRVRAAAVVGRTGARECALECACSIPIA